MSPRAAIVALALLLTACSGADDPRPRNLVLVTVDTLRADHLGLYGYPRATAPTLDALGAEALVFERCLAPIPRTTPSHLSLMTGVYPTEHGVVWYGRKQPEDVRASNAFVPGPELRAFAQVAEERGYRTAGFVSAAPVKRITGLAHGFQAWSEPEGHRRPGRETNRDALAWLEEVGERPFFLWVHYMDVHGPYGDEADPPHPPAPYDALFGPDPAVAAVLAARGVPETVAGPQQEPVSSAALVDLYDGCVRMADDCLAELVEALRAGGRWEDTVLVVSADHGQGLGQHGQAAHADVWREQLRVPLVIRAPGVAPRRVDVGCSLIDVLPTALGFVPELADPAFLGQGRGLDVLAAGFVPRPVFGMSVPQRGASAVELDGWRYVRREGEGDALYDLARDPHELSDRLDSEPVRAAELRALLERSLEEQRAANERYAAGREAAGGPGAGHVEELRDLGYAGDFDEDE